MNNLASTPSAAPVQPPAPDFRKQIRDRILEGLLFVLPIALTFWVVRWIYILLEEKFIDPVAMVLLWKFRLTQSDRQLPEWFEDYAAPVIAIFIILIILYVLGFFVHSGLRRSVDWFLMRVPLISLIYDALRSITKSLEKAPGDATPKKMVLVEFPHPGVKVPAFVTATCRDITTQKTLVCVYVPTTPMPTSGYFLLVPEEQVTELNWTVEQTLQAIMSGGLTTPPEVAYFSKQTLAGLAAGVTRADGGMAAPAP